jgi:hypothetical protein
VSAANLTKAQATTIEWAHYYEGRSMLYMPNDVGTRSSAAALVRRGLLVEKGEAKDEETGHMGTAYALTDAGRKAVTP